ncbi:MAG TPA: permease-like cell division protein FtsX [Thermoanaerobaculia bacterium]|nr:permease-like cell division protein FtsX [Thermoanaerobaculia bacterium]
MSLARALRYFVREACLNLLRSWRVSLLAVLTIAVSLVLGGAFLLASHNLAGSVESWRGKLRVVVYLKPGTKTADLPRLAAAARAAPWVAGVDVVSPAAARRRFRETFPSLADVIDSGEGEPLPASLEVALRRDQAEASGLDAWLAGWRQRPEVAMVDDDREWLGQVETAVAVVRAVGLVLGGILLGAAIFTIASIIRLTAYLHHEEIAIMRLVGATEFFIRGPFYVEGLIQGLIGGALASAGLYAGYHLIHARSRSLLAAVLAGQFLSPRQLGLLLLLGALAGLIGAVTSLRRESL